MSDAGMAPHERQRKQLHRLINELAGQLQPVTVKLAREMVDANEAAVALDLISEMLAEAGALIKPATFNEFQTLARELGLGPQSSERLRPLVRD